MTIKTERQLGLLLSRLFTEVADVEMTKKRWKRMAFLLFEAAKFAQQKAKEKPE